MAGTHGLKGQDPAWCSGGSHVDSDNANTAPRHWTHASQSLPQGRQTQLNSLSLTSVLIVSSLDRETKRIHFLVMPGALLHDPKKSLPSPGLGAQGHTSNASQLVLPATWQPRYANPGGSLVPWGQTAPPYHRLECSGHKEKVRIQGPVVCILYHRFRNTRV